MKKKIKYLIYCLILLIIIVFITILLLKNTEKITQTSTSDIKDEKFFYSINDNQDYFIVKNIVDRYLMYLRNLNGDSFINEKNLKISREDEKSFKINNGLSFFDKTIDLEQKNEIDLFDNYIIDNAEKYKKQGDYKNSNVVYNYIIEKMYKGVYTNIINLYLLEAKIDNNSLELLIKYDTQNNTFTLFLSEYIEKNNYNKNITRKKIGINTDRIEDNEYNKIIINNKNDEDMAREYYNIQRNNLIYNLKEEYNKLNKQYREKRFSDYYEYEKYFLNLRDNLEKSKLEEYSLKTIDNNDFYILIDNNGRYYIIQKKDGFENYEVFLDEYTIDTEYFTEKYNKETDNAKVVININKVMSAINNDDYNYFYNKLAESFRNKYFENSQKLQNFWENNLFKKFVVQYLDFEQEGNIFTYRIKITKELEQGEELPEGKNAPSKYLNIVMQLNEGTDFVMSFSIDKQ